MPHTFLQSATACLIYMVGGGSTWTKCFKWLPVFNVANISPEAWHPRGLPVCLSSIGAEWEVGRWGGGGRGGGCDAGGWLAPLCCYLAPVGITRREACILFLTPSHLHTYASGKPTTQYYYQTATLTTEPLSLNVCLQVAWRASVIQSTA